MKDWICSPFLFLIIGWVLPSQGQEFQVSPAFFGGGISDIGSTDPERAAKAIEKWSRGDGAQDGVPLTSAPFFWDPLKVGRPVFLRIMKNENRKGVLEVWLENPDSKLFELFKSYRIFYHSGKLGPKTRTGDLQAPEGFYYMTRARLNPHSSYHLSMDIGYPNSYDKEKGWTGDHLMIHGSTVSIGCFAMTDCSIEQIYTLVDRAMAGGQKVVRVHSFPFAMTEEKLSRYADSEHFTFWKNLKEGWDWFEARRQPPNVEVKDGRYVFEDLPEQ